MIIEIIRLL